MNTSKFLLSGFMIFLALIIMMVGGCQAEAAVQNVEPTLTPTAEIVAEIDVDCLQTCEDLKTPDMLVDKQIQTVSGKVGRAWIMDCNFACENPYMNGKSLFRARWLYQCRR